MNHRHPALHRFLSAVALTAAIGLSAAQSRADLVAHWSFDTDLTTDATGNHNGTGTVGSGVVDTADKVFGAGSYDSPAGLDYTDLSTITLAHDEDGYTVSLWVKRRSASNDAAIVLGTRVSNNNFIWMHKNGKIFHKAGGTANTFAWTPDTDWHHVVVVDSGAATDNITLYLDNVAFSPATNTKDFVLDSLGVGSSASTGAWGLDGHLDEVWVYDHALTADEVNALFMSNDGGALPDPRIVMPANIPVANNGVTETIEVTIGNHADSTQDLVVTAASVDGIDAALFSVTAGASQTIAPGTEGTITLEFTPGTYTGLVEAVLKVTSNTGGTAGTVSSAPIAGSVRDPWISAPETVDVGTFPGGSPAQPFTVEVSNLGSSQDLVIYSTSSIDGPAADKFTIDTDLSGDLTIGADSSTTLNLTFDAGGVPGTYTATLILDNSDPDGDPLNVQLRAEITRDGLPPAPIAHWTFDADFTDATGNGHDGTLVDDGDNANALIDAAEKKFGAGSFAMGDNQDRAEITPMTLASDADGYTVSLWLRRTGATNEGIALGEVGKTPNLVWLNAQSGNYIFKAAGQQSLVPGATNDADWHHLVFVDNGTGNGRTLYVDNVATTDTKNGDFTFDSLGAGYTQWGLVGNLDEVWVFDVALTAEEVGALYQYNTTSAPLSIRLAVTEYDAANHKLKLTAADIPEGQTFHLEQSGDLVDFAPLTPGFDFDSTTPQPFEITVDTATAPQRFFQVFAGDSTSAP